MKRYHLSFSHIFVIWRTIVQHSIVSLVIRKVEALITNVNKRMHQVTIEQMTLTLRHFTVLFIMKRTRTYALISLSFFFTWIVCIYHSKEIVLNKLVVKSVINSLVGDSFDIIFSWQLRTIHVQGNGWKNMFFYVLDSIYHKSVFPCVPFGFKVQRRKR